MRKKDQKVETGFVFVLLLFVACRKIMQHRQENIFWARSSRGIRYIHLTTITVTNSAEC